VFQYQITSFIKCAQLAFIHSWIFLCEVLTHCWRLQKSFKIFYWFVGLFRTLGIKIPFLKGFVLSAAKVSLLIKQRYFSTSALSFIDTAKMFNIFFFVYQPFSVRFKCFHSGLNVATCLQWNQHIALTFSVKPLNVLVLSKQLA